MPELYSYPSNDYRSYLAHHGVKGMKWGVRHEQARKARIMKRYGISSKRYDEYNAKLKERKKYALSSRGGPGGTSVNFSRKAQYGLLAGGGALAGGLIGNRAGNLAGKIATIGKYRNSRNHRAIETAATIIGTAGGAVLGSAITTTPTAVGNRILDSIWTQNELSGKTGVISNAYMNYRDRKRLGVE